MRVAILAGGLGSRLSSETRDKSKAMVTIADQPILWHVMKYYASFGLNDFVIALGYQADSIRDYFARAGYREIGAEEGAWQRWRRGEWTVDLVDTGPETQNGGRIKRLAPYVGRGTFMLTWCDGLANVDLDRLLTFHRDHGRLATLTAVQPANRFGRLTLEGDRIVAFREKTVDDRDWVNGAYFVLEPAVLERIAGDHTSFEYDVLTRLAAEGELMAFRHPAFWQCMDTIHEAQLLNAMWNKGEAPWKVWE